MAIRINLTQPVDEDKLFSEIRGKFPVLKNAGMKIGKDNAGQFLHISTGEVSAKAINEMVQAHAPFTAATASPRKKRFTFSSILEQEMEEVMNEFYEKVEEKVKQADKETEKLKKMSENYKTQADLKLKEMDDIINEKFEAQDEKVDEKTKDILDKINPQITTVNASIKSLEDWKDKVKEKAKATKKIWADV